MSWSVLSDTEKSTIYCWFPGWSFSPQVFSSLYQTLPGLHLGAEYLSEGDIKSYATILANELHIQANQINPDRMIFIGWSLGGALAIHCLQQFQKRCDLPLALVTLATGERFLKKSEMSSQGMEPETFSAFSQNVEQFPARSAKRFLGLCTQHADNARQLMRKLAATQLTDKTILVHSLRWLNYKPLPQLAVPQHHYYSKHDALHPHPLKPTYHSAENSHSFLFTKTGQRELLQAIQTLLPHNATDVVKSDQSL